MRIAAFVFRNGVHHMRKLASGSLIVALLGVCAASAGGRGSIIAAVGERMRTFRVSEPLLLLLLGMCLIVSATALPPRLRGRFRARNALSMQKRIHLAETNRLRSGETRHASIDIPPQSGRSAHNESSAAGAGN
jgi:hypothetical protein